MTTDRICPECGKPLGADRLDGLCPECMLKVGADPGSVPTVELSDALLDDRRGHATPPALLPEGSTFGPYRIRRRLGHGGMGVVYEADEIESGRRVALKIIREKLDSPHDQARFLREGRLAASINHPNCVYVFGTEEIDGIPAIAMEYVSGGTLERRLRHEGPQPIARTVDALLQVIAGLEAAQTRGILHRDIKPSNCFEDNQGVVKIGDFGLSISTAPRAESLITETGSMIGTPAYCSPEQLRGDELSGRSDMYAVGVMLYQLLTGHLPFEGKTMPQLISNALEQRPSSPQRLRKEIPNGLARVILRCLEKQPADRFRAYSDLRAALAPYGSAAPTPATLGLRFLAGVLDMCFWMAMGLMIQAVVGLLSGDIFGMMNRAMVNPSAMWPLVIASLSCSLLYYALMEWRWGATLGKLICRVRVVRPDGSYPTLGGAFLRATCYVFLPVLPHWGVTLLAGDPFWMVGHPVLNSFMGLSQYMILAVLFSTARRRNGFASVYDLWTGTRIVSRAIPEKRLGLSLTDSLSPPAASAARVGPYHVLQSFGSKGGIEWIEGYDLRLLRRVLIRKVPPGTPAWPQTLRHLTRVGRLRWLTARRDVEENWDAFEGVGGQALVSLCTAPQPWGQVRFWLLDLADELAAAEQDGTLPERLAVDRVWINEEGRAKLFDVPVPEVEEQGSDGSESRYESADRAQAFLDAVAALALGGAASRSSAAAQVALPLPIHARTFLTRLPGLPGPAAAREAIRPLLRRPAKISRMRRFAAVVLCMLFPLMGSFGVLFGFSMMRHWERTEPELVQMQRLLGLWQAHRTLLTPKKHLPSEDEIGIYLASHLDHLLEDDAWHGGFARIMISHEARAFAEASVTNYAGASPEQRQQAEERLRPMLEAQILSQTNAPPGLALMIAVGVMVFYAAVPAILAALLFRGGLVLLATGMTFVRRDGRRASRLRLLWRAAVTWAPSVAVLFVCGASLRVQTMGPPVLAMVAVCILVAASLALPTRGLQDRLSGTWPVPR